MPPMKFLQRLIPSALAASLAVLGASAWADAPRVIRMAVPGVGVGNRPVTGGSSASTMHLRGLLEKEFEKEGIRISWSFLRGAGPAVNEAYANGLVDFSLLGDLPSIIGRAGGLKTRVLAATAIRQNLYLTVPASSEIRSLKDLRGRKVSLFKGTNNQLAAAKILEKSGLSERDVRAINMDTATAKAALGTGDIDAAFGGSDYLALRDQGLTRLIYASKGDDPRFLRHCTFIGSQDFIDRYPEHTLRVVKALVSAAKWMADQDSNPEVAFQLWTRSGVTFSNYKEDWQNASLKVMSSPLVDEYIISQYDWNIQEAKRFGLIRSAFRFEDWYEPRFLQQALKELGLEGFWKAADKDGTLGS